MKKVVINKKASNSLKEFFPWVYKSDIKSYEDVKKGEIVRVEDEEGRFLAVGYINLDSIISLRVLSFNDEKIDKSFFVKRIEKALDDRIDINSNAFRIIHSEADEIPGLIVDKFDEYLSVMFNSAGIISLKDDILRAIEEVLNPKGVFVSADFNSLKKEKVDFKEIKIGEIPKFVEIEENGVKFLIDIENGQKTGFYLDQRRNRNILSKYMKQKDRVLDLFCNSGGFGLYGAKQKNAQVKLVDISENALNLAKENFKINGVEGDFIEANVFDYLRELRAKKEKFDMVIIDPPSFAKKKNQRIGALRGFKDLIVNGMKLVEDGGYMAIFSCSYYIDLKDLKELLKKASKDNKKRVKIIEHLYQDIDHPYILNNPFSLYLKGLLVKIA
ncbi:class I SAM-dependent rRNA methyltransferase [Nitrosophilus kaiyonis]|uniref:class I SAM-dependent rRNA methyltransferase n=1 Tax=Nitrosophilus kaiyonis TaxID=2930200 RepID=UPI0024939DB5|nr:class I SAM-dependent rRNA methyltransferase [Nitrosophilus kaiyonis]